MCNSLLAALHSRGAPHLTNIPCDGLGTLIALARPLPRLNPIATCRTSAAGPKIDITVFDALRRKFQCATVQLDFQLPIRFNLEYVAEDGSYQRPVIVHR